MSRSEQLVHKWLDGALSVEESEELAGLLEQRGEEANAAMELLQMEGLLRGEFLACDVADAVTRTVRQQVAQRTADQVLLRISGKKAGEHARFEALTLPHPFLRWALAVAASLLICLGALWLHPWQPGGGDAAGHAELAANTGPEPAAITESAEELRLVREVITGAEPLRIDLEDGSRLDAGKDTRLAIYRSAGVTRIALAAGSVDADVAKQPAGHLFEVTTPVFSVEVVGTKFTVEHSTSVEESSVAVEEGGVNVVLAETGDRIPLKSGRKLTAGAFGTTITIR